MTLLDHIQKPKDLKVLDDKQLKNLADEVRQFILNHVSVTGGHLASNLGIVELTIALHYVYDSPVDKIIWDVGHQSYVHKILTARRDQFDTLRQFGGLSGFPKRNESIHDVFETGHSSTSISAALGFARARDLKEESHNVIAIIGDGALTGGMAFEAMNDAGHSETNLTVILNDNEMSISPNVGALASHLSRVRSNPRYNRIKKEVEQLLRSFPLAGPRMANAVEKIKNSFKYLVVPGVIFEEMGFTYIGPYDGHNLHGLITVLKRAKEIKGPVIVHVVTKKGKGYKYAELNPEQYHGVSPFNLELGCQPKKGNLTYSTAFGNHLTLLAKDNSAIVAITAAMPDGTGLSTFKKQFPNRFFDVGIAEQHAVTLAAGLASNGIRPIVAIYSTFLQRAYDQILHDVCQQKLPVIFAIDRAGLVGEDGETHQGVFDISFLRHMPNLTIMAPKNTCELRNMLDYALTMQSPVAIRYPKGCGNLAEDIPSLPLNSLEWETLVDEPQLVILATGSMVDTAMKVFELLKAQNIRPTIVNARIIKPLDEELLSKLTLVSNIWITMEDNVVQGGFGSSINEYIMFHGADVQVVNMGIPDTFVGHGTIKRLKEELKLDPISVASSICSILATRRENAYAGFSQGTY